MKTSKRLILKPLSSEDIELVRKWRNAYAEHFFSSDYISKEQQRSWYEKYKDSSGRDYFFIIQLKGGEKIGSLALYNINNADRTAELGRTLLIEDFQGMGYMEEAINLVLDIAFEEMRLYKVKLATHLDDVRAISLYAKCGFRSLTRPVMIMEKMNKDKDVWDKPMVIGGSYDAMSDEDYESQSSNIGDQQ